MTNPLEKNIRESNLPIVEHFKQYNFELRHLMVIFGILIFFLVIVSLIQKVSLQNLLVKTQEWYQRDFAERLANITATSLELLLETSTEEEFTSEISSQKIKQAFNIILSQQILQKHVDKVGILVFHNGKIRMIDNGEMLYRFFFEEFPEIPADSSQYQDVIKIYRTIRSDMQASEEIRSLRHNANTFHVFVPFVPRGEYSGAVYVRNTPDFSFITQEFIANYNETALIFAALIMFGLLAIFYISSYLMQERDEVRELLFREQEKFLTELINQQKENLFTKRIYHTHHKAEKVMGFIKEDLRTISADNIEANKDRIIKYANFMSRVIYDMKWYDPPLQTIRNPLFRTNLNKVIRFIVDHIFLRTTNSEQPYHFQLNLDETVPDVAINEFVVWEILEPLLQNAIDHSGETHIGITVTTKFDAREKLTRIEIADDGKGIPEVLLAVNENSIQRIFLENISTKSTDNNSGYGCYLAFEISRRCGWDISAENQATGGSKLTIKIPAGGRAAEVTGAQDA